MIVDRDRPRWQTFDRLSDRRDAVCLGLVHLVLVNLLLRGLQLFLGLL